MFEPTFIIKDANGNTIEEGLTLIEAAASIMTYDGHEYEIRREESGGWRLYTTTFSRNSTAYNGLRETIIYSSEDDENAALLDISEQVINHCSWWNDQEADLQDF